MATSKSKFEFYETVVIWPTNPCLRHLAGTPGVILGKSEPELDGQEWYYAVSSDVEGLCVSVPESECVSTGDFAKREDFYDGTSIRVRVNERGEGELVDEE